MPPLRTRKRFHIELAANSIMGISSLYNTLPGGGRGSRYYQSNELYAPGFRNLEEYCIDELHSSLKSKHPKKPQGGPLNLRRAEIKDAVSDVCVVDSANWVYGYVGRFICGTIAASADTLPLKPLSENDDVASYGPAGWNKFRPGRPLVQMGTFLGELRDLPSMLKETCKRLKDVYRGLSSLGKNPMALPYELVAKKGGRQAAQDYLSYQFGWAPFLRDLIRCYQVSKTIDRSIREIRENNGKIRRRGGVLMRSQDTIVVKSEADYGALRPVLVDPMYASVPRTHQTRTDAKRIWFEGAFRYWIPDTGELQWEKRTKRLLYGVTFNAEVAWSLIPWSWLIDWFSNVGDNIASLDAGWADNLTAKYAYVMGTNTRIYVHSNSASFARGGSVKLNTTIEYSSKQRVSASPYGFGVSLDSLNARKIAILAALGMTRANTRAFF